MPIGKPQKTYFWLMFVPGFLLLLANVILAITLPGNVGWAVGNLFIGVFGIFMMSGAVLLTFTIVVTLITWRHAYDFIYLRSELMIQSAIIALNVSAHGISYIIARASIKLHMQGNNHLIVEMYLWHTLATISSVLVSTKYATWRHWIADKDSRMKGTPMSKYDLDFQSLIVTGSGLQAFLSHLAKENRVNYLLVTFHAIHLIM